MMLYLQRSSPPKDYHSSLIIRAKAKRAPIYWGAVRCSICQGSCLARTEIFVTHKHTRFLRVQALEKFYNIDTRKRRPSQRMFESQKVTGLTPVIS
jgi:hypothetical protein